MRQRRNAFTLIELLVVVAVMAVLMAFMLPALSSAKERMKAVACVGNLRQMGIGLFGYAADFNEFLPCASFNPWQTEHFVCALIPYYGVSAPSVVSRQRTLALSKYLRCASDDCSSAVVKGDGPVITSYSMTMPDSDSNVASPRWPGSAPNAWGGRKRLGQISDGSAIAAEKCIYTFDTSSFAGAYRVEWNTWTTSITYYWVNGTGSHKFLAPDFIHGLKGAFLFLDGRSQLVKFGGSNPFNQNWQLR